MKFNKAKREALHVSWGNRQYQYRLWDKWIESNGILIGEKLDMSQQCGLAGQKVNHILGCMKRSMASKSKEVNLLLCSTLMRRHWESCVQLWGP